MVSHLRLRCGHLHQAAGCPTMTHQRGPRPPSTSPSPPPPIPPPTPLLPPSLPLLPRLYRPSSPKSNHQPIRPSRRSSNARRKYCAKATTGRNRLRNTQTQAQRTRTHTLSHIYTSDPQTHRRSIDMHPPDHPKPCPSGKIPRLGLLHLSGFLY